MNFNVGDVVMLKSGGPAMTVQSAQHDGSLWCIWFDQSGSGHRLEGASFKAAVLDMVE